MDYSTYVDEVGIGEEFRSQHFFRSGKPGDSERVKKLQPLFDEVEECLEPVSRCGTLWSLHYHVVDTIKYR